MSERNPWGDWLRVRKPDDGPGVELVARIPGCLESVTRHPGRAAAEAAAAVIYDEYCAAVKAGAAN